MKAFRRTFKYVRAKPDTALTLQVTGDAGGTWSIVAGTGGWTVYRGEAPHPSARARCDEDTAWKLFFNALPVEDARRRIETEGDPTLLQKLFSVRGVMV